MRWSHYKKAMFNFASPAPLPVVLSLNTAVFPTMDAGALSEIIKSKVASLIHEQLNPIISELAAQHRMLQTHSALLKYNHNVNDYQMSKLENLRDLEQSIKCASFLRPLFDSPR